MTRAPRVLHTVPKRRRHFYVSHPPTPEGEFPAPTRTETHDPTSIDGVVLDDEGTLLGVLIAKKTYRICFLNVFRIFQMENRLSQ